MIQMSLLVAAPERRYSRRAPSDETSRGSLLVPSVSERLVAAAEIRRPAIEVQAARGVDHLPPIGRPDRRALLTGIHRQPLPDAAAEIDQVDVPGARRSISQADGEPLFIAREFEVRVVPVFAHAREHAAAAVHPREARSAGRSVCRIGDHAIGGGVGRTLVRRHVQPLGEDDGSPDDLATGQVERLREQPIAAHVEEVAGCNDRGDGVVDEQRRARLLQPSRARCAAAGPIAGVRTRSAGRRGATGRPRSSRRASTG